MGSVIGGLIGMDQGQQGMHDAAQFNQDAANLYKNIAVPDIASQELNMLLPEYLGDFNTQQENALALGPSAMEGVATDPRLMDAQMSALDQLSQMGASGLLPGEEAAMRQTRRSAAGEAQAKSAQLMDEYARRGMGGSGAELAARLQAGQSSADRMSQENDRNLQMAQERALGAISQKGALAGQINNQQFQQQSDVAKAKDYINQFNTQNQQSVQQRNVAGNNQAGMRNLSEKQRIGEAGAAVKNQQQEHNKGLIQQQFQNQLSKAGGYAGQLNNQAKSRQDQAKNDANMWGQIGQSVDKGAGAAYTAFSDENAKKNIKKFDAKSFLDALCPVEFEYIDSREGEGKQSGIMAQDLEKVLPQAVFETEKGKHIDYGKVMGPLTASVAELNERLSRLESGKGEDEV